MRVSIWAATKQIQLKELPSDLLSFHLLEKMKETGHTWLQFIFAWKKKNIKIQFRCCKCFNKSSVTVSDKNQSQHEVYVYIHTHSIFITPDDCTIKTQDKYCFKKGCEENLSFCRNYGIFLYFKTRALYIRQVFLSAMVGSLANMQRNAAVSHISCQKN